MFSISNRLALLLCLLSLTACSSQPQKPASSSHTPEAQQSGKPGNAGPITPEQHDLYKAALTSLYKKDYDDAEKQLRQLMNLRDDLGGPWANLALISYDRNQPDQARKYIDEALKRNPEQANAINLLGVLELDSGHIKKALEHFRKAVSLRPDYANAHYNLAYTYDIYLQDARNAADQYIQYLKLNKNQDKRTAEWLEQLMGYIKSSEKK